jgi:hypothetical protein
MTTQPEALRLADALDAWDGTLMMPAGWRQRTSAELRRLNNLCAEWEKKAATWLASPEAAKRLDGYRELAQRVNTLEAALWQALEALEGVASAHGYEGGTPVEAIAALRKRLGDSSE